MIDMIFFDILQVYHAQSLLDQIEMVRMRIILEGSID